MTGCRRIKDMTAFLSQADVDRSLCSQARHRPSSGQTAQP